MPENTISNTLDTVAAASEGFARGGLSDPVQTALQHSIERALRVYVKSAWTGQCIAFVSTGDFGDSKRTALVTLGLVTIYRNMTFDVLIQRNGTIVDVLKCTVSEYKLASLSKDYGVDSLRDYSGILGGAANS